MPEAADNFADDAIFLSSKYGLIPDPWQVDVIDGWLGIRFDGKWAAKRCGLAVARQNGKNGCIEIYELFVLIGLGARVLHTAHEMKTARKSFRRLLHYFDSPELYPELYELVAEVRETNGQEGIWLHNGGSIEFIARSSASGLGFTGDILVCDEAQELTDEELEALTPMISSGPLRNPQIVMTGTPPTKRSKGNAFRRLRAAGHKGLNRLCWKEWSAEIPGNDKTDPLVREKLADNRAAWYATNPSLGIRLSEEDVELIDRDQMTTDGFLRQRLGVWDEDLAEGDDDDAPIDLDAWAAGTIKNPRRAKAIAPADDALMAFGLEIDRDRAWASFGTAGQCTAKGYEGKTWVEVVERRRGTRWILDFAVELNEERGPITIAIDGGGPAKTEIEPLQDAGIDVLVLGLADAQAGVADMVDAVNDAVVLHGPQESLDDAVEGAKKRNAGGDGNFLIGRRLSSVDVTPLLSCIWAMSALEALNYDLEDSIH